MVGIESVSFVMVLVSHVMGQGLIHVLRVPSRLFSADLLVSHPAPSTIL